jgi:hypothetical protein
VSELVLWLVGAVLVWALFVSAMRKPMKEAQRILDGPDRDIGPPEPCWTDEIARDGRYSYSRGQCVKDQLIDMDRRAARGEFPVRPAYQGQCSRWPTTPRGRTNST